jgi:CRISPR-associated protein Csb2
MLAFGIRFLNGFIAASQPNNRIEPEWPPHPARVFMALAAAHFETGADPHERMALEWLESLGPPALKVPGHWPRCPVNHYVPVNDKAGDQSKPPKALIQSLPQLARDRQPRTFARAWLEDDNVYLVWPEAQPDETTEKALRSLCGKVTRVGHSTSLVQMWVAGSEEIGEVNWIPDENNARLYLRVAYPGALRDLESRYNAAAVEEYCELLVAAEDDSDKSRQREARKTLKERFAGRPPQRRRPEIFADHGYAPVAKGTGKIRAHQTVFSPHLLVFGLRSQSGPFLALGLQATLTLTRRWREALLSHADGLPVEVREALSGHRATGEPLETPHLAFVPLAFVGHPHADGHLMGMAVALPRELDSLQRRYILQVLGKVRELKLGALGVWDLVPVIADAPLWNLRPDTWTSHPHGSTHWASVTPIAFDRHPKAKDPAAYQWEAAELIASACNSIGLPRPQQVVVTGVSAHLGAPPSYAFPRLTRKDGSERRHAHAVLIFREPVVGPVLLGAGRYRGYGVCRPLSEV